jgi:predicted acylesterase/phospholipase RssA
LLISLPGAGVLVFWQLGVLKGLQQQYDLGDVPMLGSSSGALVSALAKSGACMEHAAHRGMELLKEYKVEQRPFGLIGILGRLTRQWLNDVLPEGAGGSPSSGNANDNLPGYPS